MELGEERLTEQDDGGEGNGDESEALGREGRQQAQSLEASGKRGAHTKEKEEEAGGDQKLGRHEDAAQNEPGPPEETNSKSSHCNARQKCSTNR